MWIWWRLQQIERVIGKEEGHEVLDELLREKMVNEKCIFIREDGGGM